MTNGNSSDRLDRIEALLESVAQRQEVTERIVQSNSRAIQALMEQRATERLEHEQRMARLEEIQGEVARAQLGLTRLLTKLDEERPTVLQKLNAIENKVDRLIERTSE